MKLSDGIEQAIHCTSLLASLPEGGVLSAAALAEYHGVSTSYLLKHLQALSAAGILATVSGPRGGYRLARKPGDISLLHIVLAVEGGQWAFRCTEIRRNGPNPLPATSLRKPCGIATAMLKAERAYRAELAATTMAQLIAEAGEDAAITNRGCAFIAENARQTTPKTKVTIR